MPLGNEEAKFSVVLDDQVSDSAEDAARAVEQLRDRMASSESAVKEMNAALRRLRGSSDDVKKAKEELKAKINSERDALSASQLKMVKNAEAIKKLDDRTKALKKQKEEAAERTKKFGSAVNAAGGPVAGLKAKLDGLTEIIGGAGTTTGVLTLGLGSLVAAVLAVSTAAIIAGAALAKFVVLGANAARSAGLMREAVSLDAADGDRLGRQIDALAAKLPLAKARIAEMAIELRRNNLAGQPLVDTMNAIGQATAALGDEAGNKIKALVERGRMMQNFSIGDDRWSEDLRGTGLQRDDVAKSLAKNMHVGVDEARKALMMGRVKLADGAKALRDAVESKFGGINIRKMFDLEVIGQKLKDRFDSLTRGVNLEPLLHAFESLSSLFDDTTVTGDALKQLITLFGNGLASSIGGTAPLAKQFFKGMIIASLQLAITVLTLKKRFVEVFGRSQMAESLGGIDWMKTAVFAGATAINAFAGGLALAVGAVGLIAAPIIGTIAAFAKVQAWFEQNDWSQLGFNVVDGLTSGLLSGGSKAVDAVKTLAGRIKKGFTYTLKIGSPSKVFAGYGVNTVEGYTEGVESSTPDAARALDTMAAPPASVGSGQAGGKARSVSVSMPITINVQGGAGADVAKQITSASFMAQLTKALEELLIAAGVPVGA